MKKGLKVLVIMVATFMSVTCVKADTEINIMEQDFIPYSNIKSNGSAYINAGINMNGKYFYNDFNSFYSVNENKEIFDDLWEHLVPQVAKNNDVGYPRYSVAIFSSNSNSFELYGIVITCYYYADWGIFQTPAVAYFNGTYYYTRNPSINNVSVTFENFVPHVDNANPFVVGTGDFASSWFYMPTVSFMNYYKYYNQAEDTTFKIYDGSELIKTVGYGDQLPVLYEWGGFDPTANYTEVNLDNYEYVLLSLKNYNQSDAFQTNLQVKGSIGITPIYNYGQTSKDAITGVQVQDRCNNTYTSYTSYPFYILQSDIQNNAIFAVKECSQNSSFKFDNTIFDITYVTQANKDSPTIVIGGKTYNVIPYDDLPSTATKNEEDNYIPGESGSAVDTGGLDSAIKGAQNNLSSIWNTITYFTDFIGQIFSSLPNEVHAILISAFAIMITLGIIKIFLGK